MLGHFIKVLLICVLFQSPFLAFGADSDFDGVDDKKDKCPNTAQLKMVKKDFKFAITVNPERLGNKNKSWPVFSNGCEPDDDNDGVVNSKDFCPSDTAIAISKGVAQNGCPLHSDRDGTPDFRDDCPDTPKGVPTNNKGCPTKGRKSNQHVAQRIQNFFK